MVRPSDMKIMAIKSMVILGLWVIIVLLISATVIVFTIQKGSPVDVLGRIMYELICISPWIVSTPIIIRLARSYRFSKGTILKSLAVHFAVATIVFSLHALVQSSTVFYYYSSMSFSWSYLWMDFFRFLDMRVILYLGMLFAIYAIDYQKRSRDIRLKRSKLKTELNKAKFQALLNRIQPEFLLDSIDTIRDQLDSSLKDAEETLTEFSELLRIILHNIDREEVSIRHDVKSYNLYVSLMQKRLDQEIQNKTDIDEDCYQAIVPSFLLLIPLIEKIIRLQNQKVGSLTGICYQASRTGDKIDLGIAIEGDIIATEIEHLLQKKWFSEMIESLKNKYGKELEFITTYESNLVYVGFTMPYLEAEQINTISSYDTVL